MPPAALMSATASLAPSSIREPTPASGPLVGWIEPIVMSPESSEDPEEDPHAVSPPAVVIASATLASFFMGVLPFIPPPRVPLAGTTSLRGVPLSVLERDGFELGYSGVWHECGLIYRG